MPKKPSKRRNYRTSAKDRWLPRGHVTGDTRRYARAWRRLCVPLVNFFDMPIISCDPGLLFADGITSIRLTTNAAIKIWELINKKKWKD